MDALSFQDGLPSVGFIWGLTAFVLRALPVSSRSGLASPKTGSPVAVGFPFPCGAPVLLYRCHSFVLLRVLLQNHLGRHARLLMLTVC